MTAGTDSRLKRGTRRQHAKTGEVWRVEAVHEVHGSDSRRVRIRLETDPVNLSTITEEAWLGDAWVAPTHRPQAPPPPDPPSAPKVNWRKKGKPAKSMGLVRVGAPSKGDTIHRADCRTLKRARGEVHEWEWADHNPDTDWLGLEYGLKACGVCKPPSPASGAKP